MNQAGKLFTNIGLASVGLAALAVEQAEKVGQALAEKGAEAIEQGRKCSEELQQRCKEDAIRRRQEQFDRHVTAMNSAQRQALRQRLAELDQLEEAAVQASADCTENAPQ